LVLTLYSIKMKNTVLVLFLIASNYFTFGQEKSINNYEFIIVPELFDFLKEPNKYQTSSLTKFLLKKNGFTVFLNSEEYPKILQKNACMALTAVVVDKSSLFKTKVAIELRDCFNKLIYTSKEGVSGFKDYKQGFQEAIRNAHANMNDVRYEVLSNDVAIDTVKDVLAKASMPIEKVKEVSVLELPKPAKSLKGIPKKNLELSSTLYAQPKENGFQLVNLIPKVVFVIAKTGIKNTFIIRDKNGILYKKETTWIAEFYEGNKRVVKEYNIKF
jgi:hypothetical protein